MTSEAGVGLISKDSFRLFSDTHTHTHSHGHRSHPCPCVSSPFSPLLSILLLLFPPLLFAPFLLLRLPAVQSEDASLLLISSAVVLLSFPWLGPLILQLAPVGSFQAKPLFWRALYSGPRSCIAPQNFRCACVTQSSILIAERGIIKAGLILLCQNHNTHHSRGGGGGGRGGERLSFLSAAKVLYFPPLLLFFSTHPFW